MARDLAWMDLGLCRETDPALFYPEEGQSATAVFAKRICDSCEVKTQCLDYALANMDEEHEETGEFSAGLWGIWGGTSRMDRLRMLGRRKPVAA